MRYITTTKNLLTELNPNVNTIVENGIVYQINADAHDLGDFNELKVQLYNGSTFVIQLFFGTQIQQIGKNVCTFTTGVLPEHTRVQFGLNGSKRDTSVSSPVTLKNNTTYTLSMDFINITQGKIAWTNSMLEEGSAATPYVPYGYLPMHKGRYKVSDMCQLLDKSKYAATRTINGVTFTNNGDGTITVNGTATSRTVFMFIEENVIMSKGDNVLLGKPLDIEAYNKFWFEIHFAFTDGTGRYIADTNYRVHELEKDVRNVNTYVTVAAGETVNATVTPQLYNLTEMFGAGNEPTTVEEFKEKFPDDSYPYSPYCWAKIKQMRYMTTTKNLFRTSTAVGTLDGWEQSTVRQFEEDKWYIGLSGTNYYVQSTIHEYELTGNYVYVNSQGAGYGIGRAFKCEPNQTYTIACKWIKATADFRIVVGCYDENGTFLSSLSAGILVENFTFTTLANCRWFTVCFICISGGSSYIYNIQLEEGSTATSYVPYGYLPLK